MNMKKIRFGITGSGYMARTHAEAIKRLAPAAELVAIWGGSRAPGLAQQYAAACEPTVEALMRRTDIDAVVIATPHHLHTLETLLALETGKHALIEKPMATTVADCDRMLEVAARQGLVLATGYNLRFRNNPLRLRELVAENALGRLLTLQISQLYNLGDNTGNFGGTSYAWLNLPENIGNIIDGLPHAVDLIRWMTGAEPTTVAAICRTFLPKRPPQVDDTTVGFVEFSNGLLCSVNTSCALPAPYPAQDCNMRIVGSRAVVDFDAYGEVHIGDEQGWRLVTKQPAVGWATPDTAFGDVRMKAYCNQMQSFIDGIHGKPMQAGSGRDGRAGVAVSLAMIESSRQRRWIELS